MSERMGGIIRRCLRAAAKEYLACTGEGPPMDEVPRGVADTAAGADRRARAAADLAQAAVTDARLARCAAEQDAKELRSDIEDTNSKIEVLDARLYALEGRTPKHSDPRQAVGLMVRLEHAEKRIDGMEQQIEDSNAGWGVGFRVWEVMARLDALPRYPDEWTPSPERGERLVHPAWQVTREVDGHTVVLTLWARTDPSTRVVSVRGNAWTGVGPPVPLPTLEGVAEIAHVAARYEELARGALRDKPPPC